MMLAGRSKQMPRAQLTAAAAAIAKEESKKNMDPSMGDPDLQNRLGIIETNEEKRGQHKEIKYDNLSKKLEGNFLLVSSAL